MERKNSIFSFFVFGLLLTMLVPFSMMDAYAAIPGTLYGGGSVGSALEPGSLFTVSQADGSQVLIADPITPGGIVGLAFDFDGTLFGLSKPSSGDTAVTLVTLNPDTGALVGTIGTVTNIVGGSAVVRMQDLAIHPITGQLYGMQFDPVTNTGQLWTIDKTNAVATLVGTTEKVCGGIAFTPDAKLFLASCQNADRGLVELDPSTAASISSMSLGNSYDSLTSNSVGLLFGALGGSVASGGEIVTIVPSTAVEVLIGTGARGVGDLAFVPDIPVGGTYIPIDTSALLLAGVQSISMWMIPVVVAGIGIGVFVIKRRK